jgi:hypothetical protein
MSIQCYNLPINNTFDTETLLAVLKYKVDELQAVVNQISSGSGSGSSSGSTISLPIPATQLTWCNTNTGDTLTIQQALEIIKVQVSLLENTPLSATDINCINSNNQTSDFQAQLNILYQLRNTTPILSKEQQQKLDKIPGIEEDINNIKSTLQTRSDLVGEKKFHILHTTIPSTTIMYAIAYGNNVFVPVGASRTIFTGVDTNTWKQRSSNTTKKLVPVIYAYNLFVAVGDNGTIVTSSTGTTWTNRTISSTYQYTNIIYANGMFVIVGYGGTIVTSVDGYALEEQTSTVSDSLSSIVYYRNVCKCRKWWNNHH